MRRAVRATRTAISPRLAIRTEENMCAGPLRAFPAEWYRFAEENATESMIYRAGTSRRRPMTPRRVTGRHCMAGAAGAICGGAGGAGLGAGREAACWGRRGGVGAVAGGFFCLVVGARPRAGVLSAAAGGGR